MTRRFTVPLPADTPALGRQAGRHGSIVLAIAALIAYAIAQPVSLPAGPASGIAIGYGATSTPNTPIDGNHPTPVGGKQKAFVLIVANQPAAAVTVFGGHYVFAQSCAGYDTVVRNRPVVTRWAAP